MNKTNTINEKREYVKKHPTIENGIIIRKYLDSILNIEYMPVTVIKSAKLFGPPA